MSHKITDTKAARVFSTSQHFDRMMVEVIRPGLSISLHFTPDEADELVTALQDHASWLRGLAALKVAAE